MVDTNDVKGTPLRGDPLWTTPTLHPRILSEVRIEPAGSDPILHLEAAEILRTYGYVNNVAKRGTSTEEFRARTFVCKVSGCARPLACGLVENKCVTAALFDFVTCDHRAGKYEGTKLLAVSIFASHPDFRGKGLTADLLDTLSAYGLQCGCDYLAMIWATTDNATRYFLKRGFEPAPYTLCGPDYWRVIQPSTSADGPVMFGSAEGIEGQSIAPLDPLVSPRIGSC